MKKSIIIILTMLALSGCADTGLSSLIVIDTHPHTETQQQKKMPPAHAPAYGRRVQHRMERYRYYPDVYVYYSPESRMYFYLSNNQWRISARLPFSLRVDLGDYVNIEADADKPYNEFKKHKKLYKPKRRHKKHSPYGQHYGRDKYDDRDN